MEKFKLLLTGFAGMLLFMLAMWSFTDGKALVGAFLLLIAMGCYPAINKYSKIAREEDTKVYMGDYNRPCDRD